MKGGSSGGVRDRYGEGRPAAGLAADIHFSAQEGGEMLDNVEPQADAAIKARLGTVDLIELFEDGGELLLGNAHAGIDDAELDPFLAPIFVNVHRNRHRALRREFDRVVDEIDQNLFQFTAVGNNDDRLDGSIPIERYLLFRMR